MPQDHEHYAAAQLDLVEVHPIGCEFSLVSSNRRGPMASHGWDQ